MHEQVHARRTRAPAPVPLQARVPGDRDRRPEGDDPDRRGRGSGDLQVARLPHNRQAGAGGEDLRREVAHHRPEPRRREEDLLHHASRQGDLRGAQTHDGGAGDNGGRPPRTVQHQLLQLVRVLVAPSGGEGGAGMPPGPPRTGQPPGLQVPAVPARTVRLPRIPGDQTGDPQMVPAEGGRREPEELAQRRRGLVHGQEMRSEGEAVPPLQIRPQAGGGAARVLPEVHADGLPRSGDPRYRVGAGGRVLRPGAVPHIGQDEPAPGGDQKRDVAAGILAQRPRDLRRRTSLGDNAGRGGNGIRPRRGAGRLRRRCGHGGRARALHGRQREVRGGPDLSPQMQGRDAQDRLPVPP